MNEKRILIAEPLKELVEKIIKSSEAKEYRFETALDGAEAMQKIETFCPHLVYLDLLLPEMHGIEILKKIRTSSELKEIGVIIASSNPMVQNYQAALNEGANYFLEKPFEISFLFELFKRFFNSKLKPDKFHGMDHKKSSDSALYLPQEKHPNSYLKFWGSRGSNPVSGAEYIKFGGNTSCLEVKSGDDLIIIDAGTGIRPLGESIGRAKKIHLFLSHTHWDHITGFPFLQALYHSDCKVMIWSPVGFEKSTQELFTDMLAYAYFPVRLDDIKANLVFNDLRDHFPVSIGSITIESHYAYHPGATFCFKINTANKTIGYATDNEMFLGFHGNPNSLGQEHPLIQANESIINFFKNCDLFIHEAQYTPLEYQKRVGWGHSSISNASILAKYAGAKDWIVTHHDPKHTDEELFKKLQLHKEILEDCHIHCNVEMAFDGMVIPL
ncbi:MAG TPA: response regulator [Rhabdochlamydiaceae bacterium]|nr:response regulator [Rhabdochlamydiaceae bacterium]